MEEINQESFRVNGEALLAKVKQLIKEGNVRRIKILDKDDQELIVIPLTLGVVGAVLVPALAALGAVAALVSECTIVVERTARSNRTKGDKNVKK